MPRKYEYRRKLPHYQRDNETYFITFCTHQGLILSPSSRSIVLESCLYANGRLCTLHAAVVMLNHVHLPLTPVIDEDGPLSIPEIMQGIKSASAHRINKLLGRKGKVWQDESFDRAVRHDQNPDCRVENIMGNPVRAGLVQNPSDYPWLWRETLESISVA